MLNCSDIIYTTDTGDRTSTNVTIDPSASDNVDLMVSIVCSHTSNDTFDYGGTIVDCNATDDSGNVDNCTFTVWVIGRYNLDSFTLEIVYYLSPFDKEISRNSF